MPDAEKAAGSKQGPGCHEVRAHEHNIQSVLRVRGFHICRFNQPQMENNQKKDFPESSKKQSLNLPCTGNYLHNIVFTTIYTAFTLY